MITTYGAFISNMWEQGLVIPAYDWEVLFREGLDARIAMAEAKLAELDARVEELDPAEYLAKRYEWQAMVRCGKAIIRYGQRLSETARQQAAQERDEKRRQGTRGDGGHPRARPRPSTPNVPRVPAVLLDRRGRRPLLRQMGQRLRHEVGSGLVAVLPGGHRIRADHAGGRGRARRVPSS